MFCQCQGGISNLFAFTRGVGGFQALSLDDGGVYRERLEVALRRLELGATLYSQPGRAEDQAAMIIEQVRTCGGLLKLCKLSVDEVIPIRVLVPVSGELSLEISFAVEHPVSVSGSEDELGHHVDEAIAARSGRAGPRTRRFPSGAGK